MDDIFLGEKRYTTTVRRSCKRRQRRNGTGTVYFNNLTERPAWRNSGFLAAGFRVVAIAARPRQKKSASGGTGGALKKLRTSEEN